jgi:hypothetical protein
MRADLGERNGRVARAGTRLDGLAGEALADPESQSVEGSCTVGATAGNPPADDLTADAKVETEGAPAAQEQQIDQSQMIWEGCPNLRD